MSRAGYGAAEREARHLIGSGAEYAQQMIDYARRVGDPVPLEVVILAHAIESMGVGPRKTVLALLRRERIRQERELAKAEKAKAAA